MPSQAISTSPCCDSSAAPSAAGEARGDARIALLDADAAMAGDEVLRPEPLAHGIQQHLMQIGAMDGKMRPLMPGREPPRLAVDELAVAGEEGVVLRLAGDRGKRVLQPERAQLLHRMRPEIDPDPERADIRGGLEHPDAVGGLRGVGGQRQRQPADAAADDDQFHNPLRINASPDIAYSRGAVEPPRWPVRRQYCLRIEGRALIRQSPFDCSGQSSETGVNARQRYQRL